MRRAMALTWLNPHVYLDTVVLLGSIANAHGSSGRWWFAVGACLASTLWFIGLGFGARLAAGLLATPRAWQVLDLLIAATMLGIAVKLATGRGKPGGLARASPPRRRGRAGPPRRAARRAGCLAARAWNP